jgi:predicted NBD/HSP70 family sugar kinase
MIHIGIDLHSRNMTLVAVSDNGKLLAEEEMTNTPLNLGRFFEQFNQPIQAVVECTPTAVGVLGGRLVYRT